MFRKQSIQRLGAATILLAASQALGQFEINWHTIDGGGVMNSTDGQPNGFELSGTIGQPDASSFTLPMTGGAFELVGGFWVVSQVCNCPGDMNADGQKDGRDIQQFAVCVIAGGSCSCADVDGLNGVNFNDVAVFVSGLLAGTPCP